MRIKYFFTLVIIALYTSVAMANEAILRGLFNSQETPASQSVEVNSPPVLQNTSSMQTAASCSAEDQTSLPLKFVMGLLRDRGASLVPSHNSDTGELTVYGGRMIGNCNSMLDYVISPPGDGLPYVFQVKIKQCGSPTCAYPVRKIENGSPVEVQPTPSFEPTMRGFEACLRATGVLKEDNTIARDMIVNEEFKATQRGITETSQLWFASHGPFQSQVYGTGGNLKTGHGCYYFENIQESGFQIYSRADVELNLAREEYQSICRSRNYRLIDQRISDFAQFGALQDLLVQARDNMLLEKYRSLHEILKGEDFSEANVEDIQQTIADFERYILEPLKNEIKEKYRQVANSTGQERRRLQAELDTLVDRFKSYAVSPYPNSADLRRMQEFERNAPIDDEHWSNAVLTLNRIQNTVAVYQQYKGSGRKESPVFADRRIQEAQGEFAREYGILRRLAADPNYSRVADLRRRSSSLHQAAQRSQMELQRDIQQEIAYIQQHCYGKYYIANNPISLRNCVGEAQENIRAWQAETYHYVQRNGRLAEQLNQEAEQWSRVEQRRSRAVAGSGGQAGQGVFRDGAYHFNFDNNTTRTGQGPGMMPSQMQPNLPYPAMWGQNQPNFGMNRSFLPGQYNMGFQNAQFGNPGFQPMPWQYGGFPQSPYNMGHGMGMPPAYSGHMMSGQYNFGV